MNKLDVDVFLDFDATHYNEVVFEEFKIRLQNAIKTFIRNNISPIQNDCITIDDEDGDSIDFIITRRQLYLSGKTPLLWYNLIFENELTAERLDKREQANA